MQFLSCGRQYIEENPLGENHDDPAYTVAHLTLSLSLYSLSSQ